MNFSFGRAVLVIVIVVIFAGVAFYLGVEQGKNESVQTSSVATSTDTTDYYQNVSEWQTDSDTSGGFSIAYPIDFDTEQDPSPALSTSWRVNSTDPGVLLFSLTIPKAFEPQTNFSDATLTVGESGNSDAVSACLTPDQGESQSATSTISIDGTTFTVFSSNDAGAGNYYQTWSYRTLQAGECYAVEYTIHSNQIANYPSSYNLQPFDQNKLTNLLNRIVGTFQFI
jgi:hypothetical protein